MTKNLIAALLLAMPLAAQATGYVRPPIVITKTVTVEKAVYVNSGGSGGSAWAVGVMSFVALYFGNAIYVHAACVADEDKRKVADKDRKCYKHRAQ